MSKKKGKGTGWTELDEFKAAFTQWQEKFGLNHYTVYFEQCELDGCCANMEYDNYDMVATVRLNSTKPDGESERWVYESALHEALHLLLGDLKLLAMKRCISEDEIHVADERIVRTLEKLL